MISNILTDFFNCFSVPTLVLNNNLEAIFTYKYDSNIENSFFTSKALDKLKKLDFSPGSICIDIQNNIKYTCIMFYHYDNAPMYILIGPYNLTNKISENNSNEILSMNTTWLEHVIDFHKYIIDKHICIKKTTTTTSPCVNHAIEYIKKNYSSDISIDDLCKELNINKCYFCSIFKKETGSTFINYLNSYKIEQSKELLKDPNLSLLDISVSVGFNNQSYFSTVFKKLASKTPLEFRDEILKNQKDNK